MKTKVIGAVIATAVAGLILAGNLQAQTTITKDAKVKCSGVNACKGKGACKGSENACAGKNGCKGKGWMEVASEQECTSKGGKVVK